MLCTEHGCHRRCNQTECATETKMQAACPWELSPVAAIAPLESTNGRLAAAAYSCAMARGGASTRQCPEPAVCTGAAPGRTTGICRTREICAVHKFAAPGRLLSGAGPAMGGVLGASDPGGRGMNVSSLQIHSRSACRPHRTHPASVHAPRHRNSLVRRRRRPKPAARRPRQGQAPHHSGSLNFRTQASGRFGARWTG
jgi:hypothetical protein